MSKLRLILCGGWLKQTGGDTGYGQTAPSISFRRRGALYVVVGIACAFVAPLVLFPSSIGWIPFEYDEKFLALPKWDQYLHLLWQNLLVVLKSIPGINLIGEIPLPTPPHSLVGASAIIVIALLDLAAFSFFLTGAIRILKNVSLNRSLPKE